MMDGSGHVGSLGDRLAALNATLNGASAILVATGWYFIRFKRDPARHRKTMLTALAVSAIFLVSYVSRVLLSGIHPYPGHGALKVAYLSILASHVTLAMVTVPLVLGAVWLGLRQRFVAHKKLVKYTLPIWLYVSVTGVIVYLMLYQALPSR